MSIFDHKRLSNDLIQLDATRLRKGYYSDKYFVNVVNILSALSKTGYNYNGTNPRNAPVEGVNVPIGDLVVEAQIFNRREPTALIVGVDVALEMLRHATGYFDGDTFIETYQDLEVDAVEDGVVTYYGGDPENVLTVIEIRGRYRDFALLETPILGVLSRASRVATNIYEVLEVSNGKPIIYMPARFDIAEAQAIDGYAYALAVHRYNQKYGYETVPLVSTDAQGAWWGGVGGGTVPHALIATFLADEAEMMVNFAQHIPIDSPRILLADFNNDVIGSSLATLEAYWQRYLQALKDEHEDDKKRWTLYGVRLDTSSKLRDVSLQANEPMGVNSVLVQRVREALDAAWESWDVPEKWVDAAKEYCRTVKIVVSGGFNREKIGQFEANNIPVDIYGVGSTFFKNDSRTNTDFTMDVVRVKIDDKWVNMAKVGRRPCDNPDLRRINLSEL